MAGEQLIVTAGPGLGTVKALVGEACVLGSAAGCDVQVEAPGVAPRHVELHRLAAGGWRLRALAPVLLDGTAVVDATWSPGSFLQVGSVEFTLREGTERTGPGGTLATPHPTASGKVPFRGVGSELREGMILDGRFVLGAHVASGGMGEIYRARHAELDRPVALKVMRAELSAEPDFESRFRREAMATGRIGHPNIVGTFDLGRTADGRLYCVMEWVDGETLAAVLRREGAIPAPRAIRLLAQVARALSATHAAGLVHRDLKPDNVMVVRGQQGEEIIKVLDFGVAKSCLPGNGTETAAGAVVGTPQYMSPEQAQGLPVDVRSDIYALGLIAHELLRGRPTFEAPTPSMLIVKQVTEAPARFDRPLTDRIPAGLEALVFRMLAKRPADRPQDVSEVIAVLEACDSAKSPERIRTDARAGSRRVLAAAVALPLVAVGGWIALRAEPPPPVPAAISPRAPVAPVQPAAETPAPEKVRIHFTTREGRTARVLEGSEVLGSTPLALVRPRGENASLTFQAPGHDELRLQVLFEADQELPVGLVPSRSPIPRARDTRGLKASPY